MLSAHTVAGSLCRRSLTSTATRLPRLQAVGQSMPFLSRALATKVFWNPEKGFHREHAETRPASHLAIVLDQSGSMHSINKAAYEGANELIEDLTDIDTVQLTTFNSKVNLGQTLTKAAAKTAFNPGECGGTTALYDAIVLSLDKTLEQQADKRGVIVAIVTDGFENASRRTLAEVKERVAAAHAKDWRVTFLGANQDAVLAAERMGIRRDRALTYGHSSATTREAFHSMRASNQRYHNRDRGEDEAYTNRERISSDPGTWKK